MNAHRLLMCGHQRPSCMTYIHQVPHTDQSQIWTLSSSGDTEAKQPYKHSFGTLDTSIEIFKTGSLKNPIFIKVCSVKHQSLHNIISVTKDQILENFLSFFLTLVS